MKAIYLPLIPMHPLLLLLSFHHLLTTVRSPGLPPAEVMSSSAAIGRQARSKGLVSPLLPGSQKLPTPPINSDFRGIGQTLVRPPESGLMTFKPAEKAPFRSTQSSNIPTAVHSPEIAEANRPQAYPLQRPPGNHHKMGSPYNHNPVQNTGRQVSEKSVTTSPPQLHPPQPLAPERIAGQEIPSRNNPSRPTLPSNWNIGVKTEKTPITPAPDYPRYPLPKPAPGDAERNVRPEALLANKPNLPLPVLGSKAPGTSAHQVPMTHKLPPGVSNYVAKYSQPKDNSFLAKSNLPAGSKSEVANLSKLSTPQQIRIQQAKPPPPLSLKTSSRGPENPMSQPNKKVTHQLPVPPFEPIMTVRNPRELTWMSRPGSQPLPAPPADGPIS
ncbi:hypothetical protein PGT21_010611 [Puccinia graminis f. sp. tritici]|uniref:Uncharacterized protein n=1 Tax=Puccinia graminis f. sp. tritici TaxID=56615 RepID=A0A5B0NBQ2_PUCGR|nr:hypothetical protein PGT21_010611 [Puccinia graminis f. sp. tritici]